MKVNLPTGKLWKNRKYDSVERRIDLSGHGQRMNTQPDQDEDHIIYLKPQNSQNLMTTLDRSEGAGLNRDMLDKLNFTN